MDDDELALLFSARKENEELKQVILNDHREIERLCKHIKGMRAAYSPIRDGHDKMKTFIEQLDRHPMFWGISYKRFIKQFLDINFPEK